MPESTSQYSTGHKLFPQEEMLQEKYNGRKINIGIPKENGKYEYRIPLAPDGVKQLCKTGHKVFIEKDAGIQCNWHDQEYSNAGAIITNRAETLKQEIIAKISPFSSEDIMQLNKGQMLFSALHTSSQTPTNIKKLMAKKVTAIAFELIKDEKKYSPFLHPTGEISGILAVSEASKYMSLSVNGRGVLLGGITGMPASEIIILGAGIAGLSAANAAAGLGANVKVFDYDMQKLYNMRNAVSKRVDTFLIKKSVLKRALKTADVVIGALSFNSGEKGGFIDLDMLVNMKKNAVIIDLNADNISCFESSRPTNLGSPVYKTQGVIHYCVPNIASLVPTTSSEAFSNALTPVLADLASVKRVNYMIAKDDGLKNGTYIYNGILTNKILGKKFNFSYSDINLIASVF